MKKFVRDLIAVAMATVFFHGCKKDIDQDNCEQIQKVRISIPKTSYHVGDSIVMKMSLVPPISLVSWNRGIYSNQNWDDTTLTIYPCTKEDDGWWYLNVSYPGCAVMNDSAYISVLNNPVNPVCTTQDNVAIFSAIPDISFTSTSWGLDPDLNARVLQGATPGDQYIKIYFNSYWNSREPEDGAYNTYSISDFYSTNDLYSVYMVSGYSGLFFTAGPGKLYVTHENQKLKVTFCSASLTATDGYNVYTTSATGSVVAP
jgi:hypothetical protein